MGDDGIITRATDAAGVVIAQERASSRIFLARAMVQVERFVERHAADDQSQRAPPDACNRERCEHIRAVESAGSGMLWWVRLIEGATLNDRRITIAPRLDTTSPSGQAPPPGTFRR